MCGLAVGSILGAILRPASMMGGGGGGGGSAAIYTVTLNVVTLLVTLLSWEW